VEEGGGANAVWLALKRGAMSELRLFELLDALEMAVHQRGVGEGPEMLGGLEFWRIRRQEEQVDVVGHAQPLGGMPPSPIED
jgi:hypothetical protein